MPGLLPTCGTARPGAVSALATATAISFLFIENVSSFILTRGQPNSATRSNPCSRLLQFCRSALANSIRSVNFCAQRLNHVAFSQQGKAYSLISFHIKYLKTIVRALSQDLERA